ncbi:MAG: FlgB family protein [Rhodobacteraceae bacterium]|nr:FlgB family protein [Paracoccaceae bacterium]
MFADLNVFRLAHAMARHAGLRQAVVSENMANADTPDYRTRDVTPFRDALKFQTDSTRLRATRPNHFSDGAGLPSEWSVDVQPGEVAPNGNSVSVELEMLKAIESQRQHSRALAIYKSSMTQLRTSLGRF